MGTRTEQRLSDLTNGLYNIDESKSLMLKVLSYNHDGGISILKGKGKMVSMFRVSADGDLGVRFFLVSQSMPTHAFCTVTPSGSKVIKAETNLLLLRSFHNPVNVH